MTVIFVYPVIIFTVITEHPGHGVFWNHPRTYDQILAIKVSKGSQVEQTVFGVGNGKRELSPAGDFGDREHECGRASGCYGHMGVVRLVECSPCIREALDSISSLAW